MSKTLLLADDSVTIQKVVGISFANEDIRISTVDNGDDAIVQARELHPDVILADVVMPGKSGYEVCEAVKADPELRHIPVLLLTGTFEAFDEERAARAGAAGQIAKPFEAQTLVKRVKELLAQAPAPAESAAAPPTRAAAGSDSAFDFFDDAVAEAMPSTASNAPASPVERAELEIDGPDATFAFGEDELDETPLAAPLSGLPPAAHTVAILPDDPAPEAVEPLLSETPPPIPSSAEGDGFDFEFESAASTSAPVPPESGDLAESMLLDPAGDSAFDVSSSELRDLAVPDPIGATQLMDAPMTGPTPAADLDLDLDSSMPRMEPDPVMEILASDPLEEGPEMPSAAFVEEMPTAAPSRSADPMEFASSDPMAEPEPWSDAAAEPEPWPEAPAEPEPAPWPAEPEPAAWSAKPVEPAPAPWLEAPGEPALWPAEPAEPEPMRAAPVAKTSEVDAAAPVAHFEIPDDALAQIAPALQEQLHETLEKIAWEAFGQVTDTIVQQAVERLEKIAWEVVPKLAETLIQEEIRKLKNS